MLQDSRTAEVHTHSFGPLEFKTRGLGVFFPSEKLVARIRTLSPDELREANKAAWKVRRTNERIASRYSNVTLYGWGPSEGPSHCAQVAAQICKATWRALQS